jgi:hypothetical protein
MASSLTARAAARKLENADELIGSVETFIFDCDGAIYVIYQLFMVNSVYVTLAFHQPHLVQFM